MTATPASVFDLGNALPRGFVALEASAGTGKTYALAALTARFLAERADLGIGEVCIVTFTEAATAELRDRVRSMLVDVADLLATARWEDSDNQVAKVIANCGDDERARRVDRLRRAVMDFDLATISTIHAFCLRAMALAPFGSPDQRLVDGRDEIAEVANDVIVAHDLVTDVKDAHRRFVRIVDSALANPTAQLGPDDAADAPVDAAQLVRQTAELVRARRAETGVRSFDDLLYDTLRAVEADGSDLDAGLRGQFKLVLVDEFQDTDAVQWSIFRRVFADASRAGGATMVVVGDPKQAIYRFRSADVATYVQAVASAPDRRSLAVNWRSDPALLRALDALFRGARFGSGIAFSSVLPRAGALDDCMRGRGAGEPLQLRLVHENGDPVNAARARRLILADVVSTVAGFLRDSSIERERTTEVRCSDIAVLTRTNEQARAVAAALLRSGIPAATSSTDSVMSTEAASQMRALLEALERPASPDAARAAALGWFFQFAVDDVAAMADGTADDDLAELHQTLHTWSEAVSRHGVPELLRLARGEGLHARLLSRPNGERHLTDLEHVAELLQLHADHSTPAALLGAMERLRTIEGDADVVARRIDTDDDAVQVLTIHRAKGLEFPIVLCPFMGMGGGPRSQGPYSWHDPEIRARVIDTSEIWREPDKEIKDNDDRESCEEDLRLLYVALTRAAHRCVVWWPLIHHRTTYGAALSRVLVSERDGTGRLADLPRTIPKKPAIDFVRDSCRRIVSHSRGTIGVHEVTGFAPRTDQAPQDLGDEPSVASFTRRLDESWRTWSFTRIKAQQEGAQASGNRAIGHGSEHGADDEPPDPEPDDTTKEEQEPRVPAPLDAAWGGTAFGTLVHKILERVDFASPELHDELVALSAERLAVRPMGITPEELATGLEAAIRTPLGQALGHRSLADVGRQDRLDELNFDMPLAQAAVLPVGAIGEVLAGELPADDPLAGWFTGLASGLDMPVSGVLNGSIDLVFRVRTPETCRYWVVDYKTNRLGSYDQPALAEAMAHSGYPLQAALYLVATHRYLRWRHPGYDPGLHLGGVGYLFVRGMHADPGSRIDAPDGVFWWQPPASAVERLSDLLDRGAR